MPAKNEDLHGNAPDESPVALLLIDLINDFDYPGGEKLQEQTLPVAERIARLKRKAKQAGIPVIYVNDNFGRWRSDFQKQVQHCLEESALSRPVVEKLLPEEDDYYVLKPKHSAFYATPLELLLSYLKVRALIITGIAGDLCILFTAGDAFLRDYHVFVPSDCTASIHPEANRRCLEQMQQSLDADTRPSTELDLEEIRRKAEAPGT